MSSPTVRSETQQGDWTVQLAGLLGAQSFPAAHDDLATTLVRHHAPSHLFRRLSGLPRTLRFSSLLELLDHLRASGSEVADGLATERFPSV